MRAESLLSSRLYGRPRSGRYAFTGSCAVGRSRAIPPIRELHPCPEDRSQHTRSSAPPTPTLPPKGGGRIEKSPVLEVALAGEDHRHSARLGGRNFLAG